ncbi:hypothetical protein CIB48_g5396 [Xylaria polymorpha]|nr:hypothetical protein CIB48_g5396 [Xylaria polymorpha]
MREDYGLQRRSSFAWLSKDANTRSVCHTVDLDRLDHLDHLRELKTIPKLVKEEPMSGIRKPPALSIVTLFSVQMSSFPETAESDGLRDVAPGIESASADPFIKLGSDCLSAFQRVLEGRKRIESDSDSDFSTPSVQSPTGFGHPLDGSLD